MELGGGGWSWMEVGAWFSNTSDKKHRIKSSSKQTEINPQMVTQQGGKSHRVTVF